MGQCCESQQQTEQLATQAGNQIGFALLEKGQEKADETSSKLLSRVETTFDDTMDKMINKKLLEKCDSTFDKAVDLFIDKTVEKAMEKIIGSTSENMNSEEKDESLLILSQVKERKEDARTTLKSWGLPQILIDNMDSEGWLDVDNWHVLTKDELKHLGFGNGHIELFINGMRENELKSAQLEKLKLNQPEIEILASWGIPSNLIDKMEEVGWKNPAFWDDLLDLEYELHDLGFKNGHISTFKRKFKEWKEDQDSKVTDRKVQLLRKLEKRQNEQHSILKRNIDVENATKTVLQVRIIGERKYDSFASKYDSKMQENNEKKIRELNKKNLNAENFEKTIETQNISDQKKNKSYGGTLGVTVAATPVNASIGANCSKEEIKRNEENSNETEINNRKHENAIRKKRESARFASKSAARQNISQHKWDKVSAGFTDVLPKQTLRFPVQINDPNSVVYMTIYIVNEKRNLCENVQIDSNYIRIENVKNVPGRIQWQNFIKMPQINKYGDGDIAAAASIVFMHEFLEGFGRFAQSRKRIKSAHDSEHMQQLLSETQYDLNKETDRDKLIKHIQKAWSLCDAMYGNDDDDNNKEEDLNKILNEYIELQIQMTNFKRQQAEEMFDRAAEKYEDNDSDDEELFAVSKFFDVDGYSLLKKWKLEQFYERMAQEGWETPLDWIHLDDAIMRENLGFRAGHIQIFNRKFDLWVKKYNEVRRTIEAKKKGKDGTLIVGENEIKFLKGDYFYEFTKVVIRKGGTLTTKAWSPKFEYGGVLFLKSHQEIVLESGAKIDVSGKGFWGAISANPKQRDTLGAKGLAPGASGGVDSRGWRYSDHRYGGGGGGYGTNGYNGYAPESKEETAHEYCGVGGKGLNREKHFREMDIFIINKDDQEKYFRDSGVIRHEFKHQFQNAMGSGGGTYAAKNIKDKKRGGTGGGAIKLQCDKLIMYQGSAILANGSFHESKDPLSSGGSGGSIYVSVKSQIITKNKNEKDESFIVQANGGGWDYYDQYVKNKDKQDTNWIQEWKQYDIDEQNKQNKQKIQIGLGGNGRIRIDYHSPLCCNCRNVNRVHL